MPEAQAPEADLTSTFVAPTAEELSIMMELKAEQEHLLEKRVFYRRLVNYLYNDFKEAYKESCDLRQERDNLVAEIVNTAVKVDVGIPEEHKWTQSTCAQGVESIEDFFLGMLEAPGSESITSSDLPPGFPSVTPYSDLEPHMGAAVCECPNYTADAVLLNACGTQTAANATIGVVLHPRPSRSLRHQV